MNQNFEKWGKQTPFNVPENYFDEFDERLMQKISSRTRGTHTRTSAIHLLYPLFSVVAILLVIALVYLPNRGNEATTGQPNQGNLTSRPFFNYSPGDFYADHELLEIMTEKGITDFELFPDSLANGNQFDEELTMVSLLY